MAEEIENAAMNVPRAIVTTVILNGTTGWAMVIAMLFCLGDIQSVIVCFPKFLSLASREHCSSMLQDSPTGYPFIQVFYNGTGRAGATVMTAIVIIIIWCAVIGFAATASRMTWSFARDHGLPFHQYIQKVCGKQPLFSSTL